MKVPRWYIERTDFTDFTGRSRPMWQAVDRLLPEMRPPMRDSYEAAKMDIPSQHRGSFYK